MYFKQVVEILGKIVDKFLADILLTRFWITTELSNSMTLFLAVWVWLAIWVSQLHSLQVVWLETRVSAIYVLLCEYRLNCSFISLVTIVLSYHYESIVSIISITITYVSVPFLDVMSMKISAILCCMLIICHFHEYQ